MTKTALRSKTSRVAGKLEAFLGTPVQAKRRAPPLDMLIATMLSQNTNDRNSHRAYSRLREQFPTWSLVLSAPTRSIASAIRTGGMANQKSVRIKTALRSLHDRFGSLNLRPLCRKSGEEIFEILLELDGVRVKTVSCVLLFSMGRDVFPVDTHVHRICNRLGLAKSSTPDKTFDAMKGLVPKGKAYSFHTNLIRFGRKVCRSSRPLCGVCPLYAECKFPEKQLMRRTTTHARSSANHNFMLLDNVA